jgi:hypothetical protein
MAKNLNLEEDDNTVHEGNDVRRWHLTDMSRQARDVRFDGDCVAKLLAAPRARNYRIQMNGVFESTLRACARP